MSTRLLRECSLDEECSYLDGKKQTTHYKIIQGCAASYCHELIHKGWRRFGNMFFRPICAECNECQSLKIDVNNFSFSKSQRRIFRKNAHLTIVKRPPQSTKEHLELFDKYHTYKKDKSGWEYQGINPKNYYISFVEGHGDFGYEIAYYDGDKLIGVDLVDILDDGISSIYFFYDPDYDKHSLGKYSLLLQVNIARQMNKSWIYLGYYVKDCPSLSYKDQYTPLKVMRGRPSEYEDATWDEFVKS